MHKMNTGSIGLEKTKFTINFFFLMARIAAEGESISGAKNFTVNVKKF
ncbi:hypothetical protein M976_02645 [Buttiauxella ferragutiae ATCC 51602]|uniref:Uncharacterized protein n=1 Tax=Buttiauxella ferragutiae ATCC 51602 TaxID=1354252 RepID=A0ABX2W7D1_9ENTR|nr:hypothetical protein M976_02645 [Buttiauxella ferragutiae ATCC 51602]